MPYYNAGDYYGRGDYYQAGGLFSGIGSLFKKAVTFALHTGPLAPIGAALDVRNALRQHGVNLPTGAPTAIAPTVETAERFVAPAAGAGPPMIAPPAGPPGMALMTMPGGAMTRHRAVHWNKSTYVTRGGGTSRWPQQLTVHPKGTEAVTARRINVANPRALRRALRRAAGFVKLARRAHVKLAAFHGRGAKKKRR